MLAWRSECVTLILLWRRVVVLLVQFAGVAVVSEDELLWNVEQRPRHGHLLNRKGPEAIGLVVLRLRHMRLRVRSEDGVNETLVHLVRVVIVLRSQWDVAVTSKVSVVLKVSGVLAIATTGRYDTRLVRPGRCLASIAAKCHITATLT